MNRPWAIIILLLANVVAAGCIGSETDVPAADAPQDAAQPTSASAPMPAPAPDGAQAGPAEPAAAPLRSESKFGNGTAGVHLQGEPQQGELASWDVGFDERPTLLFLELQIAHHADEAGVPRMEAEPPTVRFYAQGALIHETPFGLAGGTIISTNKTGPWRIEIIPGDTVTPGFDWCAVATQYYGDAAYAFTRMSVDPPRILGETCEVS